MKIKEDYIVDINVHPITFIVTDRETLTPAAYASIQLTFENGVKVGKLMGLIRHPEYKGDGICEVLLKERVEMCKYLGCKKIYTGVLSKREGLIKLYKEYGFKEVECNSKKHTRLYLEW